MPASAGGDGPGIQDACARKQTADRGARPRRGPCRRCPQSPVGQRRPQALWCRHRDRVEVVHAAIGIATTDRHRGTPAGAWTRSAPGGAAQC